MMGGPGPLLIGFGVYSACEARSIAIDHIEVSSCFGSAVNFSHPRDSRSLRLGVFLSCTLVEISSRLAPISLAT